MKTLTCVILLIYNPIEWPMTRLKNRGHNMCPSLVRFANDEDIVVTPMHYYRIMEFLIVFDTIADIVICKMCKSTKYFIS